MCPPEKCCCCDLYSGVKAWTVIFLVLQVLGTIRNVLQVVAVLGIRIICNNPDLLPTTIDDDDLYPEESRLLFEDWEVSDDSHDSLSSFFRAHAHRMLQKGGGGGRGGDRGGRAGMQQNPEAFCKEIGALVAMHVIALIASIILLAVVSFGVNKINNWDGDGILKYFKINAFGVGMYVLFTFIGAAMGGEAPGIVGSIIGLILSFWYLYAVNTLGWRIKKGEISANDQNGGGYGTQLSQQPVAAVAVPVA